LNAAAAKQAGADATAALSWFRFGGSSYIVVDNSEAATFQTGVDHAIKLVGYSDLSKFNYDAEMEAFV
jgi:S-layer protein